MLYHTCTFIFALWRLVFKRHWNLESQEIRKMQGQSLQGNRVWRYLGCKVEKFQKGSLDLIPSPSPLVKIQYVGVKICLRCKGKTLFFFSKVCWYHPAMFCLITLSKLFRQLIWIFTEGKAMGSSPGYLLESFLLYLRPSSKKSPN